MSQFKINFEKKYGEYKDDVIAMTETEYKKFCRSFYDVKPKTINTIIYATSAIAVMNGWRAE